MTAICPERTMRHRTTVLSLRFSVILMMLALPAPLLYAAGAEALGPPDEEVCTLLWADEFDSDQLDTQRWVYRTTQREGVSICLPENISVADGRLWIDLKKQPYGDFPMTCGGVITRDQHQFGYFETRTQMAPGYGWHEAFWTTNAANFNFTPEQRAEPRVEIDGFEHYAGHDEHKFTYGVIQWHPLHGSVSRGFVQTEEDLSQTQNVFGFEVTPDYIAFFYNGRLLEVTDMRKLPKNAFHVWLSCIATTTDGIEKMRDARSSFDYYRCYELDFDSPAYQQRRERMMARVSAANRIVKGSDGIDLWMEAEGFPHLGAWSHSYFGGAAILFGGKDRVARELGDEGNARTIINVETGGRYRLWVRSNDYAEEQPGSRQFGVAVNGRMGPERFGTHGRQGWGWQPGPVLQLTEGPVTIELVDTSGYFGRCDKLLLTTDLDYTPTAAGAEANVTHQGE